MIVELRKMELLVSPEKFQSGVQAETRMSPEFLKLLGVESPIMTGAQSSYASGLYLWLWIIRRFVVCAEAKGTTGGWRFL